MPTPAEPPLRYLAGYPEDTLAQVRELIREGRLGERLLRRYAEPNPVRTDAALYEYTIALKTRFMRSAPPLAKVVYDNQIGRAHV